MKNSHRNRALLRVITMCFLLHVWYRLGFNDVRFFDWISLSFEIAVVLLVGYEAWWVPWRERRWVKKVYSYFEQGVEIFARVPRLSTHGDEAESWNSNVDRWGAESLASLKKMSPRCAAAFLHHQMAPTEIYESIHPISVHKHRELAQRLLNLRAIMEKPEIYV